MSKEYKYNPGTILLLEEGEYSDFGYVAQLVTLQELDLRQVMDEFKAQYQPDDKWDYLAPSNFVAWLCSTQRCAQLECQTAHIGSYGELKL